MTTISLGENSRWSFSTQSGTECSGSTATSFNGSQRELAALESWMEGLARRQTTFVRKRGCPLKSENVDSTRRLSS